MISNDDYVKMGNIPYEATEEKLKDIFSEVGPVLSFKLVFDRDTGKPKGYGFCEYKDQETALSAMRNLNGYEIGGRTLRVDNACTEKSRMEMQSLLQGPVVEHPYGDPVPPERAPEAISRAVASLPPEQMFELMKQMKLCIQNNPNEARAMLIRNPQLAYALLQAQVVMKIVDPHTACSMLHKTNPTPITLLPSDKPVLAPAPVPAPIPQPVPAPASLSSTIAAVPLREDAWPTRPSQVPPSFGASDIDHRVLDRRMVDPRGVDARPLDPRAVDTRMIEPHTLDRHPLDTRSVDPRVVDPRIARLTSGDQDLRILGGPPIVPQQVVASPRENFISEQLPLSEDSEDSFPRDPRAVNAERFPLRDPRTGSSPLPVPAPRPAANLTPPTANIRSALGAAVPANIPGSASDQEKAALIMQVLQLSDEQISLLPPEQRQSILVLKEQIAKSTHL